MVSILPQPRNYYIGKEPAPLSANLVGLMEQLETTMLGHILYWGCMDRGIQAMSGYAPRTVGRALTVQCPGPDSTMLHHAIGLAKAGDVLVIDRLGDDKYACLGDGVAAAAMRVGIIGAVIDGPCTDASELAALAFPVWCRGTSPTTTRLLNLAGRAHVPISCGGVSVASGDVILADGDGVFALPPLEAEQVGAIALKRAQLVEERRRTRSNAISLGQLSGATAMIEKSMA